MGYVKKNWVGGKTVTSSIDGRRGRRNKINGRVLIYRDLAPPPLFAGAEIHCSKMFFVRFFFPFFFVGVQQNLSLNMTRWFFHAN